MLWYKISLSKKDVANGKINEIKNIFYDYLIANYTDINTSELTLLSVSNGLNDYKIYFSPKCATVNDFTILFDAYSAEKCTPPDSGKISFLAGDKTFAQKFIRYQR